MTKYIFFFGFFFASLSQVSAQITVVLQPGAVQGKDAVVWSTQPNSNQGNVQSTTAYTWTNSGNLGVKRAFLEFDLSAIPANATITSANLSLYYNPTDPHEGFSLHTGNNDIYIQRVTAPWDEQIITWNNQPSTTTTNQVVLPPSSSPVQDYTNIDVKDMVVDMLNPSNGNNGFLIRMVDENNFYRSVLFASSDNPDPSLHPKLEITYTRDSLNCTTIKPGAAQGKDAVVLSTQPNSNKGTVQSTTAYTWTNSGNLGVKRAFLEFDFSAIPANATITSANLSLYYNPTDPHEGFSLHTGINDIYIQRVTAPWDEQIITWNNQPTTTTTNQVVLPPSSSPVQDYTNIDVKDMVVDMLNPSNGNNGFLIRMVDENNFYRSVLFASSDNPDSSLHPEIEICWTFEDTTSLHNDNQNPIDILLYPNPSPGTFTLKVPKKNIHDYLIEIYDLSGRKIENFEQEDELITINEAGLYIIKVSDEYGNYTTQKVIIH